MFWLAAVQYYYQGRMQGGCFGVNPPPLELDILQNFITCAKEINCLLFSHTFCLLICRLNANTTG